MEPQLLCQILQKVWHQVCHTNIIAPSAQPNEVTTAGTAPQSTPNATTRTTAILTATAPAAGTVTAQASVTSETTTTMQQQHQPTATTTAGSNNSELPTFTADLELLLHRRTERQSAHHLQVMEVITKHRRMMAEFPEHRLSNNVSYQQCLLIYTHCLFLYFRYL